MSSQTPTNVGISDIEGGKRSTENPNYSREKPSKSARTQSKVEAENEKKVPWGHIFMNLATSLTQRSADVGTGVGCVLVNTQCQILGMGYNGEAKQTSAYAANHNTEELMVHAEMNALAHASVNLMKEEIYVFVTRQPCEQCMKGLAQYNIKAIFYLIHAGYNSFVAADNRQIAMVQYESVFNYNLDALLKDRRHSSLQDQSIELTDGDKLVYNFAPVNPANSLGAFMSKNAEANSSTDGSCESGSGCSITHPVCSKNHGKEVALVCSECVKDQRKARLPPSLLLPRVQYERWCKDFRAKTDHKAFN